MIKISIQGYEEFVNKIGHMVVDPYTNNAIKKSILNFQRTAQKETPTDVGILKNTYETRFSHLEGELRNTSQYGIFVHEGTKPHWTSKKNVEGWAKRHGVEPWIVQRSIAKKGTKANPFLTRTVEQEEGKVEQFFSSEYEKLFKTLQ